VIAATAAAADASFIGNLLFGATTAPRPLFLPERFPIQIIHSHPLDARRWPRVRKLIAFKKHGIPIDLEDALRKSAGLSKAAAPKKTKSKTGKTPS
jgi:hypothetical protein